MFLIIITYTQSMDTIDAIRPKHRQYLQRFYDDGVLLVSGPHEKRNGKMGGIVIGKFKDSQEAKEFTNNDPYNLNNAAIYEIVEFKAAMCNEILKNYVD